jgi:hypothetical protein
MQGCRPKVGTISISAITIIITSIATSNHRILAALAAIITTLVTQRAITS